MQIDVNQTLQLRKSARSVFVGLSICLVLFALSLAPALMEKEVAADRYLGWAGVVVFGAALGVGTWRLRHLKKPVVTLGPQGICCAQTRSKFVPWSAVADLSVRKSSGRRGLDTVLIKLSGSDLEELSRVKDNPWGRPANPLPDITQLYVVPWELGMKTDDLLQLISIYADAHRPRPADRPPSQ
jgi:hypothetical protein